ncbi:SLAM family member 7-like [Labrus mixtus]|uniref:SLAM family member 7-like n=1 Tax=Labrus mixtus TaxID=508554 RepID=UPI0029C04F74|nr:SLAM family member 7-like [Labrus mixtus]
MGPSVMAMFLAGWVCVSLAAETEDSGVELYKKVGDDVILMPSPTSGPITSIEWKYNKNLAAFWIGVGEEFDLFVPGHLNLSTGALTITGLTRNDTGSYSAEISGKKAGVTQLIVLSPVPKPTVEKECDLGGNTCDLTCDGNTAGAEPVTYKWNFGHTEKGTQVKKNDTDRFSEFICEVQNPVSQESSQPVPNPMLTLPDPEAGGNLNIQKGVIVFVCLLSVVVLLLAVHRKKAGMWFFQKESLPWEADFWRKQESPPSAPAESNGTTSQRTDEETPMT